jgi:hypothetical protein
MLVAYRGNSQRNVMANQARFAPGQIAGDDLFDQLRYTGAVIGSQHDVGAVLQRRQRIGNGGRAFAHAQKRMIVFRIAYADGIVCRYSDLAQRRRQAARLGDAGGQHHDGALVEDDLQLQAQVANDFEYRGLVRLPGRNDDPAHRDGMDLPRDEHIDEDLRRTLRQYLLFSARRPVNERAVLGDDALEQVQPREHPPQVIHFATRNEDQFAAAISQALQGANRRLIDAPVMRDGAVVVAAKH